VPLDFADYDPDWPRLAAQATGELVTALPGLFSAIEHVGSTSVPGLAAKPIIDLMAATDDLHRVVARDEDLRLLGYQFHDAGMPGRLFYRRGLSNAWTHHLHVVHASTFATRNQLLLRDYLRSHPDDAARYGALKRRLAALHDNGDDYTRAKTELIQELTDKGRAERGLPPVPVWEE
jgi:GrpB-like predicted nucleotidyltransferase (UPF0157 family)